MTREELEVLANVRIASPCPVRWAEMRGDGQRRFCNQCRQHVHKLSELKTADVVALLRAAKTERTCVQVFYRLDGTVLTKDCASAWSVGLSEAVRRVGPFVWASSVVGAFTLFTVALALTVLTLFTDELHSLVGMSSGGLPGSTPVVKRVAPPRAHPARSLGDDSTVVNAPAAAPAPAPAR